MWTENGGLIRKITYSTLGRQLSVLNISCSLSEILITTEEGGAYILTTPDKVAPDSSGSNTGEEIINILFFVGIVCNFVLFMVVLYLHGIVQQGALNTGNG